MDSCIRVQRRVGRGGGEDATPVTACLFMSVRLAAWRATISLALLFMDVSFKLFLTEILLKNRVKRGARDWLDGST